MCVCLSGCQTGTPDEPPRGGPREDSRVLCVLVQNRDKRRKFCASERILTEFNSKYDVPESRFQELSRTLLCIKLVRHS